MTNDFSEEFIELDAAQMNLEALLAASQAEFPSTGMSEDEIMEFDRGLLDQVRKERTAGG